MSQRARVRVVWTPLERVDLPCYIPPDVKRQSTVAYTGYLFGKALVTLQSGHSTYIYYDEEEFLTVKRVFKHAGLKKRATCLVYDRFADSVRRHTHSAQEQSVPAHPSTRRKLTIEVYGDEAQLEATWSRIRATLVLQGGQTVFVGHKMGGES